MDVHRLWWGFLGFVMGLGLGFLFSWLLILLDNTFNRWLGRPLHAVTLGSLLPLAIILGLAMALNMMHPPFGD